MCRVKSRNRDFVQFTIENSTRRAGVTSTRRTRGMSTRSIGVMSVRRIIVTSRSISMLVIEGLVGLIGPRYLPVTIPHIP